MIIKHLTDSEWHDSKLINLYYLLLQDARNHDGVANKRHAACITRDHEILSFGINSYKTSPLQKKYGTNPYQIHLHAEIEALSRATRRSQGNIEGSTCYVVRVKANGEPALSKPCPGCEAALFAFGVREVFHT